MLGSPTVPPVLSTKTLELYTDSVFSVGIRSVFLGIYHTDTEGKLGRYISVKKGGSAPLFPQKGGNGPLFEKLDPLLEKRGVERGEVYKKGGIDTDRNTENPANLIPAKYRYRKNCW